MIVNVIPLNEKNANEDKTISLFQYMEEVSCQQLKSSALYLVRSIRYDMNTRLMISTICTLLVSLLVGYMHTQGIMYRADKTWFDYIVISGFSFGYAYYGFWAIYRRIVMHYVNKMFWHPRVQWFSLDNIKNIAKDGSTRIIYIEDNDGVIKSSCLLVQKSFLPWISHSLSDKEYGICMVSVNKNDIGKGYEHTLISKCIELAKDDKTCKRIHVQMYAFEDIQTFKELQFKQTNTKIQHLPILLGCLKQGDMELQQYTLQY